MAEATRDEESYTAEERILHRARAALTADVTALLTQHASGREGDSRERQ
jgi:hypothetical protein